MIEYEYICYDMYLILCQAHLDDSRWVVYWMVGISVILLPAIKVRRVFTMGFRRCQQWKADSSCRHLRVSLLLPLCCWFTHIGMLPTWSVVLRLNERYARNRQFSQSTCFCVWSVSLYITLPRPDKRHLWRRNTNGVKRHLWRRLHRTSGNTVGIKYLNSTETVFSSFFPLFFPFAHGTPLQGQELASVSPRENLNNFDIRPCTCSKIQRFNVIRFYILGSRNLKRFLGMNKLRV